MNTMYNTEEERIATLKYICEEFDRNDAYEWEVLCGQYVMNNVDVRIPLGVRESGIWEEYEKIEREEVL